MTNKNFKAMVVSESEEKTFSREISTRSLADLPEGEVLIKVSYSSLNYKDALSASGNKGVTRNYPHTPGIDASGIVEESTTDAFQPGDQVIVTSYDLGMNTSGGFAEYIRVPADWVLKLPENLTLQEAMVYGTAGFTAGMSIEDIVAEIKPDQGEILVTGASGGVGSLAVAILAKLGYQVVAVTGKPEEKAFLTGLGAREIISREEAADQSGKPVLKARWAGVVDTVGGEILATAIKAGKNDAVVTCCGLVASPDLPLTVFPFILRGIKLLGIDSQHCPMERRRKIWEKLANEWKLEGLQDLSREVSLEGLDAEIQQILKGKLKGRTVVKL